MAERIVFRSCSLFARLHFLGSVFLSGGGTPRSRRNHGFRTGTGRVMAEPFRLLLLFVSLFALGLSVSCGGDESGSSADSGGVPPGPAEELPDQSNQNDEEALNLLGVVALPLLKRFGIPVILAGVAVFLIIWFSVT